MLLWQISASALRAKHLRDCDQSTSNPSVTSTPSRPVDRTVPVLVRPADDHPPPPSVSAWMSEYNREYRPYERSRYRARVDSATRRQHADLKPSTRRSHQPYLMTCWPPPSHISVSYSHVCVVTFCGIQFTIKTVQCSEAVANDAGTTYISYMYRTYIADIFEFRNVGHFQYFQSWTFSNFFNTLVHSVSHNNHLHTYYMFLSTLDYKFLFNYPRVWRSYAILSATTQFT